jgi:hypothetical protein
MSYVVYNIDSTLILGGYSNRYATERAAKAGLTRAAKKDPKIIKSDYDIAEYTDFLENIEKTFQRINLMSGKPYMERANTPASCSPASETYWSM